MEKDGKVGPEQVVSIEYELRNEQGALLDETGESEPLRYLHGAGQLVRGVEKALEGREVGDVLEVVVPPDEGYGERDPERVFDVPLKQFDFDVHVGQVLQAQSAEGHSIPVRVTEVGGEAVTLDANHPLAGLTLHFKITVVGIREATAEEKDHGHACGGHQCHHC